MTSRERIHAALCFQPVDRVPCDLNLTLRAYERLRDLLGACPGDRPKPNLAMEVIPHPDLLAALGVDCISVKLGGRETAGEPLPETVRDAWGVEHRLVAQPSGHTYEAVSHPLANADRRDLAAYPWPGAEAGRPADLLHAYADDLHRHTDLALVGRFGGPILEIAAGLLGMEEWYVRLATDPDFIRDLLDRIERVCTAHDLAGLDACAGTLSVMKVSGEDFGTQQSLLYSPETIRALLLPVLRRRWDAVRAHRARHGWTAKIMLHSCGAIRPIIPDLLAAGIEVLDPVQPLAAGMDADSLRREFGGRLVFHGGVDVQRLLPRGTPDEVRRETRRVLSAFDGLRGGFIVAPSHAVQADIPPENVVAMTEAVRVR